MDCEFRLLSRRFQQNQAQPAFLIGDEAAVKGHQFRAQTDGERGEIRIHPDIRRRPRRIAKFKPQASRGGRLLRARNRRVAVHAGQELHRLRIRHRRRATPIHDLVLRDQTQKTEFRLTAENQITPRQYGFAIPFPRGFMMRVRFQRQRDPRVDVQEPSHNAPLPVANPFPSTNRTTPAWSAWFRSSVERGGP